jgi:hypothetical protein
MSQPLQTMKQVVALLGRPAHRVIHLCEAGVVCPTVGASGRGSVRRFSRDDLFRVALALDLQDAGAQAPLLGLLMGRLDRLMALGEVRTLGGSVVGFDLITAFRLFGSDDEPALVWLTPPGRAALVTPRLAARLRAAARADLHRDVRQLLRRGASLVANLTMLAAKLRAGAATDERRSGSLTEPARRCIVD